MNTDEVYFAKVKPNAIIPTKREEDAGYDVYACFEEDFIEIRRNEIKVIPTGIASAFSNGYGFIIKERGSTGTKGLAVRAGVFDSGFRNEWQVVINNISNKPIYIAKDITKVLKHERKQWKLTEEDISDEQILEIITFYPYDKAIAQAIFIWLPKAKIEIISYNDLLKIESERGLGMLDSTNK